MAIRNTINYPFNRIIIKSENLSQQSGVARLLEVPLEIPSEKQITITGQLLICEIMGSSLEPSSLVRIQLHYLQSTSFSYLNVTRKRALNDILRASQVIREVIWDRWDELFFFDAEREDDEEHPSYFTGSQAEIIDLENYRDWLTYTDPLFIVNDIECYLGNWLKAKIWKIDEPWTWPEIYALLSLWTIDESAVSLNMGNPYKAAIWLMRTNECNLMASSYTENQNFFSDARKEMAFRGAMARLANDPRQKAKDFVLNCWQVWREEPENYKSKADFAKDMLKQEQCNSLKSQKKIEDWCREWEKSHPAG